MRHGKKLSGALSGFRERQALRAQIEQTRHTIDSVQNHFEHVVDPTLIDCYIYELNAAQLRYQFLLRRFKSLEADA
ncbi:MAG: YaaL family protein [Hungatella sp.]|nr:YaaL family protein [Hungatella sp.]